MKSSASLTWYYPINAEFRALVPDGGWDEYENAFANYDYYSEGEELLDIPRQGRPVEWNDLNNWTAGASYKGPDISDLVQTRINNSSYDPNDLEGKYFGLVLYGTYLPEGSYMQGYQYDYSYGQDSARLYVTWIPGKVEKAQPKEIEEFTDGVRSAGDPVDVVTGAMHTFPQVDFTLSGINESLEFSRRNIRQGLADFQEQRERRP